MWNLHAVVVCVCFARLPPSEGKTIKQQVCCISCIILIYSYGVDDVLNMHY